MASRFLIAYAMAGVALAGPAGAGELAPGSGYSIHLAAFEGVVYYTMEQDGYRVVATLASGVDAHPIRMISTLLPGQSTIVSVPKSAGRPPLEFEVSRDGDKLIVPDAIAPVANEHVTDAPAVAIPSE
jgi:hypothetical protein